MTDDDCAFAFSEARKNNATFQSHCHPGIWVKGLGKYNCCNNIDKNSKGCEPATIDLASKTLTGTERGVGVTIDLTSKTLTGTARSVRLSPLT